MMSLPNKKEVVGHILLARNFCCGDYVCNIDGKIWVDAFNYILQNANSLNFHKTKIHTLWTVNGGYLRNRIRDDNLILAVLKITMPGYFGKGLNLYRGECRFLYDEWKIGFCWSLDKKLALAFAQGLNAIESSGVLLEAYTPSDGNTGITQ